MGVRLVRNGREPGSGSPLPWTGAPCSPKRTPDFLSSFPASANFMRLSLMKAAHAGVGGAPRRKSAYMGRKRRGAAPSSANLFSRQLKSEKVLFFISNSPQKRHPERSASQTYRVAQRLTARSRRTPRVLILPVPLGAFQPPKPALGGPATVFPWGREQEMNGRRWETQSAGTS
jgi:hypothetical protein